MGKLTETIRRLLSTNRLNVFDHFLGMGLKELKVLACERSLKLTKENTKPAIRLAMQKEQF